MKGNSSHIGILASQMASYICHHIGKEFDQSGGGSYPYLGMSVHARHPLLPPPAQNAHCYSTDEKYVSVGLEQWASIGK